MASETFATRAVAAATSIDATLMVILVRGYATEGDCRIHSYARLPKTPTIVQPWHFKDNAGAYWQLADGELTPEMFGAVRGALGLGMYTVSGNASQLVYTNVADINGVPIVPQVGQTINVPGGAGQGQLGGFTAVLGSSASPSTWNLPLVTTVTAVDTSTRTITLATPLVSGVTLSNAICSLFWDATTPINTCLTASTILGRPVQLENGAYGCTSGLNYGVDAASGQGGLRVRGRGAARADALGQYSGGTIIRFFGASFNALFTAHASIWRTSNFEDFCLRANEWGAATHGLLWNSTYQSNASLLRIGVSGAIKSFSELQSTGGYAGGGNGEFIYALKCGGDGYWFFYMDGTAGQAFDHMFVEPEGGGPAGPAYQLMPYVGFEIGGPGGGFGLTVLNCSFSFYGDTTAIGTPAGFATAQPSILLKNNGVTGDVSFLGGRVEKCSTVVQDSGGAGALQSNITFRNLSLVGMHSCAARPTIKLTSAPGYYKYLLKDCFIGGWSPAAGVQSSLVNVNNSSSQIVYDNCNISTHDTRYDTQGGSGTNAYPRSGFIEYRGCGFSRGGSGGPTAELLDGKVGPEEYGALMKRRPTDAIAYGRPSNLLIAPDFNRQATTAGMLPWKTTDGNPLKGIQRAPIGSIKAYSAAPYATSIALTAGQGVYQDIPTSVLPFSAVNAFNEFFYQAKVRVAAGSGTLTISILNPTTGRVYDSLSLGGDFVAEPALISLKGDEITGAAGNVRLLILNNGTSGAGISFEHQFLTQDHDGTFIWSTGAARRQTGPWSVVDDLRVNGRLALPHYSSAYGSAAGLVDLESDIYLESDTEQLTYAARAYGPALYPTNEIGAWWVVQPMKRSTALPTIPTAGIFRNGDLILKSLVVAAASPGWLCTTSLANTDSFACSNAWASGTTYTTTTTATSTFVATNGGVFQCAISGNGASTVMPTQAAAGTMLSDGYNWNYLGLLASFGALPSLVN